MRIKFSHAVADAEPPTINAADVRGEPWTGFEKAEDKGPFNCSNCNYFDGESCGQEIMMKRSTQPRLATSGRVQVSGQDCCEYIDRKGGQTV